MTPQQLQILQHALGRDAYGRGTAHRNHFCASPGPSSDLPLCVALVDAGFMLERRSPAFVPADMRTFSVTPAGIEAVERESPKPPRVSRSKERYAAFLRADSGLTFGEWLRARRGRLCHEVHR